MSYEMTTRTGKSFWDMTSVMQNSIRKGDFEIAGDCMWELIPKYTPYLRKRLLVISAEDCFGVITKEILQLSKIGDEEALTRALALMCLAKKNRDADYVCCNLMYADDPTFLDKEELGRSLFQAIRRMDVIGAGHIGYELYQKNRKKLWETLCQIAEVYYPHLLPEIKALYESNELMTKPAEETIFAAKALVLLWTERDPKEGLLGWSEMSFYDPLDPLMIPVPKMLCDCHHVVGNYPDWAYNWHTKRGKYVLRRDTIHAIANDQKLLTPLEENLFDDCSWNRDHNICLNRWNPKHVPLPYNDGKIDPAVKYGTKD